MVVTKNMLCKQVLFFKTRIELLAKFKKSAWYLNIWSLEHGGDGMYWKKSFQLQLYEQLGLYRISQPYNSGCLDLEAIFAVIKTSLVVVKIRPVWDPVQAIIFSRPYFHHCLRVNHYCKGRFQIHLLNQSSHMIFIYLQSVTGK